MAVAVLEGDARPVGPTGKAKGGGKIAKSLVPNSVVFQWGGGEMCCDFLLQDHPNKSAAALPSVARWDVPVDGRPYHR